MIYHYTGIKQNNEYVSGTIEADDKTTAIKNLKNNDEVVLITYLQKQSQNKFINKINDYMQLSKVKKINERNEKNKIKKYKEPKRFDNFKMPAFFTSSRHKKNTIDMTDDMYKEILNAIKNNNVPASDDEFDEIDINMLNSKYKKPEIVSESLPKENNDKKGKSINWDLFNESASSNIPSKNIKLKIKNKELLIFTKRLQVMLSSGMTLLKSLMILKNTKNKNLKIVVESILDDIQSGTTFSNALAKYPTIFNYTYISLISIGESSGSLEQALLDIIDAQEKKEKISKKTKSSIVYPISIGIALLIMLTLGSLFYIPLFKQMFVNEGYDLPFITEVVFFIADSLPYIIFSTVFSIIGIKLLMTKNKRFRFFIKTYTDKWILTLPIISKISKTSYMYNFSYTVGLMLKNGIRLKDAILLAEKTINNLYIKNEIKNILDLMMQGVSFSEAVNKQIYFDDILPHIVLTGEESGKLSFSLLQISKYYTDEINKNIDILLELIQPVSIILIALIVIPVVIAIYLPILDVSSGVMLDL